MQIHFQDFKTTLFFDTSRLNGSVEEKKADLLKETICRLPYSSLDQKQISSLRNIVSNSYDDFLQNESADW